VSGQLIDLTGQRFSRLSVIELIKRNGDRPKWLCQCDCGNSTILAGHALRSGNTKSCGCWKREESAARVAKLKFKHGEARQGNQSREFKIWANMHTRCYNANRKQWRDWGGRGIKVCERWHKDNPQGYQNFLSDMGRKPNPKLTLERINNESHYSPSNCKWATRHEQRINRRKVSVPQLSRTPSLS
jgi:hypothetical protein